MLFKTFSFGYQKRLLHFMLARNVLCKAITFQIANSLLLESGRGEAEEIVASNLITLFV